MLTREDLQNITQIVSSIVAREIATLAISTQKQFAIIDKRFESIENRMDTFSTKTDIARLEGIMLSTIRRTERHEDDMRVVKTKLKLV